MKKPITIISTIIVFILFLLLASALHKLITTLSDSFFDMFGIGIVTQCVIVITVVAILLTFVFNKNILKFFAR